VQGAAALITLGLFKKVVIADTLAPRVNTIFDSPQSYDGITLLLGVYAFALQIYGDFSGYSDIARGSARLLGFDLPLNFREPYLSPSITQFWRDWHISLSSWLRDYLYVPLGGNRRGPRRTMINLFLVMLLGGLWHGAAWTFVVWGALHGLYLAFERVTKQDVLHEGVPRWRDAARIIGTFHLACFAWIFFRAASFDAAWRYIAGLARPFEGQRFWVELVHVPLFMFVIFCLDVGLRAQSQRFWRTSPAFVRGAVLGSFWMALFVFSGSAPVPFIYFQF
jgi:D-alanyl-lipoteichoic acid acyltransferase DltB (MBOAT superfamily)